MYFVGETLNLERTKVITKAKRDFGELFTSTTTKIVVCLWQWPTYTYIIKSSTIINNGLNMTHSLYKKKSASNPVKLGATTSCNLKQLAHLIIATMAFSGLKKYKQLSTRARFWMKKTSFAFKDPDSMGIAHFIVRAQDQELWRYLVNLGSSDMLGSYSNLMSDTNFY